MSFFCLLVKSCHLIWKRKVLRRLDLKEKKILRGEGYHYQYKITSDFLEKRYSKSFIFFSYKLYTFHWGWMHRKKKRNVHEISFWLKSYGLFQTLRAKYNYLVNWSVRTNNSLSWGSSKSSFFREEIFFFPLNYLNNCFNSSVQFACLDRKLHWIRLGRTMIFETAFFFFFEIAFCILFLTISHTQPHCLNLRPSENLVISWRFKQSSRNIYACICGIYMQENINHLSSLPGFHEQIQVFHLFIQMEKKIYICGFF